MNEPSDKSIDCIKKSKLLLSFCRQPLQILLLCIRVFCLNCFYVLINKIVPFECRKGVSTALSVLCRPVLSFSTFNIQCVNFWGVFSYILVASLANLKLINFYSIKAFLIYSCKTRSMLGVMTTMVWFSLSELIINPFYVFYYKRGS